MKFGRPLRGRIRHRQNRYSRFFVNCLIGFTVACVAVSAFANIRSTVADVAKAFLEVRSVQLINEAVKESVKNIEYSDLVNYTYNESGKITAISADTAIINTLKSDLTLKIISGIEGIGENGFSVPIGSLTDIILLSGTGPKIHFRIVPYGTVDVNFRSVFTDAGINQTRHEIYIDVKMKVGGISAVTRIKGDAETSVMVAQTVIVGDVPQWCGGFSSLATE